MKMPLYRYVEQREQIFFINCEGLLMVEVVFIYKRKLLFFGVMVYL